MDSDISHAVEERLVRIEEKIGLPPLGEEEEETDKPDEEGPEVEQPDVDEEDDEEEVDQV